MTCFGQWNLCESDRNISSQLMLQGTWQVVLFCFLPDFFPCCSLPWMENSLNSLWYLNEETYRAKLNRTHKMEPSPTKSNINISWCKPLRFGDYLLHTIIMANLPDTLSMARQTSNFFICILTFTPHNKPEKSV